MNLDDESILSAYLDDELDPVETRAVEQALAADPGLAVRVVGLATAGDAVAGLSRLASPCSLASTVLARIADGPTGRPRRPYFWLATAASLVFASLLALRSGLFGAADPAGPTLVVSPPEQTTSLATLDPTPGLATEIEEPGIPPSARDPLGPLADPSEPDRRAVVDLMDHPGLKRVVLLVDVLDSSARDDVNSALRDTARKNPGFGRLTVPQGVVVDLDFPNEAEVFPVRLDAKEYQQMLARLGQRFPEIIEDSVTDPAIGTQLAQLEQVAVGSSRAAAGLVDPPADPRIAAMVARPVESSTIQADPAIEPPDPASSDPFERERARTVGPDRRALPVEPLKARRPAVRPKRPTGPEPVLIWLTSNTPSRANP